MDGMYGLNPMILFTCLLVGKVSDLRACFACQRRHQSAPFRKSVLLSVRMGMRTRIDGMNGLNPTISLVRVLPITFYGVMLHFQGATNRH